VVLQNRSLVLSRNLCIFVKFFIFNNERIYEMKKTALILSVALGSFSGANAMDIPAPLEAPAPAVFRCITNPPVDLVRKDGRVSIGFMSCKNIRLSGENYNGIPMLAPLVVDGDMSDDLIVAALTASFGSQVVVIR
jgi:hypothetical protein